MILAGLLAPIVLRAEGANVLVYSSLGALATILAYDAARWLFPRRWFRVQARLSRSAPSAPLPGCIVACATHCVNETRRRSAG